MPAIELVIASTTLTAVPKNTGELLNNIANKSNCNERFGNNFYPIIGLKADGSKQYVCSKEEKISPDLILIIVPDDKEFRDDFSNYLKNTIAKIDCLYVVLHLGRGSKHNTHENTVLEVADSCQEKIRIAKEHHTSGYSLGDGLEKVAEAVLSEPVNIKLFEEGIKYLKTKPIYHNPLKEAHCRIWKAMRLAALKIKKKNNGNEGNIFSESKSKLVKDEKIRQVKEELNSWSLSNFGKNMEDLLTTLNNYK